MAAASRPLTVKLRSGDVVLLRQIRPGDAPGLARAYANLGEQSRYRRFFTLMPELPDGVLEQATEVDHDDHEALVATPLLSNEIIGECRFVRLADNAETADLAVTVIDSWQSRGLGSVLLARLSERALEVGVTHFSAEILADNRAVLGMLPHLGRVESQARGPVISARIEIGEPTPQAQQDLLELLTAAARGEIVGVPGPLRRLIQAQEAVAQIVWMPVSTLLRALRPRSPVGPGS
jgi:GNAT superfamily N-acetyltransferase